MSPIISIKRAEGLSSFPSDVFALLVAQRPYGPTQEIAKQLTHHGALDSSVIRLEIGEALHVKSHGAIAAGQVLFVGSQPLSRMNYTALSTFAQDVLLQVDKLAPSARSLALIAHGPGFGLDKIESFTSSLGGLLAGLAAQRGTALTQVTYLVKNDRELRRFGDAVDRAIDTYGWPLKPGGPELSDHCWAVVEQPEDKHRASSAPGPDSDSKPHVFVAMPFDTDFRDVYELGIEEVVQTKGYLCERIDENTFTGDILAQIKKKIETAELVVAELTGANPNVHLEIGYAWGHDRPTILIAKEGANLVFDVRNQRCLFYRTIVELRQQLGREISQLTDEATAG